MRFLLLLLALLPVAAVAQIETPGTGGGGGGGGGTGTPYYGPFTNLTAYGTASNKSLFISPLATTATGIVVKAVASQSADLFIAETSTGAKQFALRSDGSIEYNNAVISYVGGNGAVRWGGGGQSFAGYAGLGAVANPSSPLVYLYPDAAAILQLGADAATATAQTIKAHDGSGSDKSAADMTIATGKSTGAGTGGNLKFKTSFPDAAGSSLNGYQTRYAFSPNRFSLSDSVASTIFSVDNLTSGKIVGIEVFITTYARNGNDAIVNNDVAVISAFNDGAGIVTSVSASNVTNSLATLNSMTTEITAIDNGGGGVGVQVKPTIGVSGWSIYCIYQARVNTDAFVDVNSD